MKKGLLLAGLHAALIPMVLFKAGYDKSVLPKGWAKVEQVVSTSGYYASLHLIVDASPGMPPQSNVEVYVSEGKLMARAAIRFRGIRVVYEKTDQPRRKIFMNVFWPKPQEGGETWMEAAVPERGSLRPVRLGVMKNGQIVPYFSY
jgi:hypothetical protein